MQDRNNYVDCGVFMCCYAFGIFKLKEEDIAFTNVDARTQVYDCFHVKCKIMGYQSHFNFNLNCVQKWRKDMKKLMYVLEQDNKSKDSFDKFYDFISEPKTLQKVQNKKRRSKRGKVASKSFKEKKIDHKIQKKKQIQ